MKRQTILVATMFLAACGTGTQYSTSGGLVGVGVVLVSPVFFGSGNTAPANLEVVVENRGAGPVVVRSVRAQSSGMVQWGIYPVQRMFNETISPGDAKAFPLFATAATRYSRMSPNEPLSVRAIVEFETAGKRYQEVYHGQAHEP